jgi:hypothetical protein
MNSNRDVVEIIPVLLEIIPKNQTVLRKEIDDFYNFLWNKAPELRKGMYWGTLGNILNNLVGELDADWKLQLAKAFNNEI